MSLIVASVACKKETLETKDGSSKETDVDEDFEIGYSAAQCFGKSSIVIHEGVYPVSYAFSKNGTTLVNVTSY